MVARELLGLKVDGYETGGSRIVSMEKIEMRRNQVYRLARPQHRVIKLPALLRRLLHIRH